MSERFLLDENGPIATLSIDCLKPPIDSENILESIHSHLPRDIGYMRVSISRYILFADRVFPMKNGRWSVPELSKIIDSFERVITID